MFPPPGSSQTFKQGRGLFPFICDPGLHVCPSAQHLHPLLSHCKLSKHGPRRILMSHPEIKAAARIPAGCLKGRSRGDEPLSALSLPRARPRSLFYFIFLFQGEQKDSRAQRFPHLRRAVPATCCRRRSVVLL